MTLLQKFVAQAACVAGLLTIACSSRAATVVQTIEVAPWSVWYTASTMEPSRLLSNTVFNFWQFQSQGLPTSVTRESLPNGRLLFRLTTRNVPAGITVFTNVRNNHTGVLKSSNRVVIGDVNGTYTLNRIVFN